MRIMYCMKHDRRWDSDTLYYCPDCEHEIEDEVKQEDVDKAIASVLKPRKDKP